MLDIYENVPEILESIDGFLLINIDGRIEFMCKKLMNLIGVEDFETIRGQKLTDVITTNKTPNVLETGERQVGTTYLVKGYTIVSNAYPIYKDGELVGALEYDVFEDVDLLREFLKTMSTKQGMEHFGTAIAERTRMKYTLDNIRGSGSAIRKIKNEILQSSRSASTVIIQGETGTGKEMIAQAIHSAGSRGIFEFVTVNCASIPTELFESELFGYEEGSFTGARKGGKKGLIEFADKGTLFLDEIETLPLQMQAKLLRFLEDREVRRVGGASSMPVDVRIICAANENLADMVGDGTFREDLYYRLNVVNIYAAALRDRKSDIPELINAFIDELNPVIGRNLAADKITDIDDGALKILIDYDWPGNVRELKNNIERAMNRCAGTVLTADDFPWLTPGDGNMHRDKVALQFSEDAVTSGLTLRDLRIRTETEAIRELIVRRGMSVTETAKLLDISRQMLHKKIRGYRIKNGD